MWKKCKNLDLGGPFSVRIGGPFFMRVDNICEIYDLDEDTVSAAIPGIILKSCNHLNSTTTSLTG